MNKFASFDFKDAYGINELTQKYPLAGGTNVFVSEGKVLIQYQDGQEDTNEVKAINLEEQILSFERAKEEFVHSNKVNALQIADAEEAVNVAQADMDSLKQQIEATKKGSTKLKEDHADAEEKYKSARARLREVRSQTLLNEAEITRLDTNIELFREKIAELRG